MRLFIALPLPPPALAAAGAQLRHLVERNWPVRWVREEGLHVTLKFFGEVTSDRVDVIEDLLRRSASGIGRFNVVFRGCGAFPNVRRARVLRLDLQAGRPLEVLQDRLERAALDLGFAPEGRPFVPHITLGRVREGHRLPADAGGALEAMPSGFSFEADQVVLFESTLTRGGSVYVVRSSEALTV